MRTGGNQAEKTGRYPLACTRGRRYRWVAARDCHGNPKYATFQECFSCLEDLFAAEVSGKRQERNWDKVVTEAIAAEPEEKPQGDAALNEFFKDLYSKGMYSSYLVDLFSLSWPNFHSS